MRRRQQQRLLVFTLAITISVYLVWWLTKSSSTSSTTSKEHYKEINVVMFGNNDQLQQPNGQQIHNSQLTKCEHLYGKILILQFVSDSKYAQTTVRNALQTVQCYATLRSYELLQVIWNNGKDIQIRNTTDIKIPLEPMFRQCQQYSDQIMVLRHCVAKRLLVNYDYIIQIDADTGIVNPKRCFEEFINPGIDVHLQLRFHTGEIQAGNYIVRRSTTSNEFLENWVQKTTGIFDQVFLLDAVSEQFLSKSISNFCAKFKKFSHWRFVKCVVSSLRKLQENTSKNTVRNKNTDNYKRLLIYARAQGFARGGWFTDHAWADTDFMFYAMKEKYDVVYTRKLRDNDCYNHRDGIWGNYGRDSAIRMWKSLYVGSVDKMKQEWWMVMDRRYFKRKRENAIETRISTCWPYCNHLVV